MRGGKNSILVTVLVSGYIFNVTSGFEGHQIGSNAGSYTSPSGFNLYSQRTFQPSAEKIYCDVEYIDRQKAAPVLAGLGVLALLGRKTKKRQNRDTN